MAFINYPSVLKESKISLYPSCEYQNRNNDDYLESEVEIFQPNSNGVMTKCAEFTSRMDNNDLIRSIYIYDEFREKYFQFYKYQIIAFKMFPQVLDKKYDIVYKTKQTLDNSLKNIALVKIKNDGSKSSPISLCDITAEFFES